MTYSKPSFRQHKTRPGPSFRFKDDLMDSEFSKGFPAIDFLMGLKHGRIHVEEADVVVTLKGGKQGTLRFSKGRRAFELSRPESAKMSVTGMVKAAREFDEMWGEEK